MKIAVLDTGIDLNHPLVKNNIVKCYNGTSLIYPDDFRDNNGHGTHVASIITSIYPDCELYIAKILNSKGRSDFRDLYRGFAFAFENEVDIINVSLGSDIYNETVHTFVNLANSKGVSVVAAAAYHSGKCYPANLDSAISVGAVDYEGNICSFNTSDEYIDIYAPGLDIIGAKTYSTKTRKMSGTSQATAYVSGVLAALDNNREELYKHVENKILKYKK